MLKKWSLVLTLLGTLTICGCTPTYYNVRAYDLSGKLIYEGVFRSGGGWFSEDTNEDGKTVQFYNATVVLEER